MAFDINHFKENVKIEELSPIHNCSEFDCGDRDLNDFLQSDALDHKNKSFATTTLFVYNDKIIGYCSILTDSIKLEPSEKEDLGIDERTRYSSYPAIKIGRFAVDKAYQGKKAGEWMLKYIVGYILKLSNFVGCRFVTVDAYHASERFYAKYGFLRNQSRSIKTGETISMRYDLNIKEKQ